MDTARQSDPPATDRFRSRDELLESLPYILSAPADEGQVRAIVIRPAEGQRRMLDRVDVSARGGLEGDHWAKGCWLSTEDGAPHPDVQVCIMSARCIEAIAGPEANWAAAGDNLFIDMDLSPENLPPGTRVAIEDSGSNLNSVALESGCPKAGRPTKTASAIRSICTVPSTDRSGRAPGGNSPSSITSTCTVPFWTAGSMRITWPSTMPLRVSTDTF